MMMGSSVAAALLLVLASAEAGLFTFNPKWDTLRVTWGLNLFNPSVFAKMPLTEADAKNAKFTELNPGGNCISKFLGKRYMKPGDNSVIIIYDNAGYLAGIQTSFYESAIHTNGSDYFQHGELFIKDDINGNASYILTAYLVNPGIICTGGRTQQDFDAQKGGTGLFIQNGTNPQIDYMEIPKTETGIQADATWKKGHCFRSMGLHYWYNVTKDMDCTYFRPMFLLYNHHKLTAFGWAVPGDFSSPRYEHPPRNGINVFMDPVPDCLYSWYDSVGKFSTMHIFMNAKPWNLLC